MRRITLTPIAATLLLAALPLAAVAQDKKPVTPAEMNYQAGGSPLAGETMVQTSNPKGPADDDGRIRARATDLLRALRRLPRRAAQGRHRQAA